MGGGLVGPLTSYLDTQTAVWLADGDLTSISSRAKKHMANSNLLISPMVVLELQYLFEIKRNARTARDLIRKLEEEVGVKVCQVDFGSITTAALDENWTRDPFDRIIVAHAKANNFAHLISSDEKIRRFYPRAIW